MDIIPTKLLVVARTVATICLPVGAIFCPAYTNAAEAAAGHTKFNVINTGPMTLDSLNSEYGLTIKVNSPFAIDSHIVDIIDASWNTVSNVNKRNTHALAKTAAGRTAIQRKIKINVSFFILSSYSKTSYNINQTSLSRRLSCRGS